MKLLSAKVRVSFLAVLVPVEVVDSFSRHAFQVLCRAPRSTLADPPPGVRSLLLPLRYKVTTSLCGPLVGSSSPGGSTRVPFYLVGDLVGV